jgi:hypothetical protein
MLTFVSGRCGRFDGYEKSSQESSFRRSRVRCSGSASDVHDRVAPVIDRTSIVTLRIGSGTPLRRPKS